MKDDDDDEEASDDEDEEETADEADWSDMADTVDMLDLDMMSELAQVDNADGDETNDDDEDDEDDEDELTTESDMGVGGAGVTGLVVVVVGGGIVTPYLASRVRSRSHTAANWRRRSSRQARMRAARCWPRILVHRVAVSTTRRSSCLFFMWLVICANEVNWSMRMPSMASSTSPLLRPARLAIDAACTLFTKQMSLFCGEQ